MSTLSIIVRIVISAVLGGIIGFERERHKRDAGIRTHMLVCLGSSLFMIVSTLMSIEYKEAGMVDPSRIASGVVTGIGFLGAGTLLRYGSSIRGLTTAASIWVVSAIGLAVGAGFFIPGVVTTVVVMIVLMLTTITEKLHIHLNTSKNCKDREDKREEIHEKETDQ
ncbi:MAG: MgtC/SapB family protein [Candidatus Omnitrophica bacterium]|nr:MgtC/SapB family protein [Candidatus Omnitrophota bacterium]